MEARAVPTHVQRKHFEHPELAAAALQGFIDFDPSVPGAKCTADVREIGDALWLYLTHEGPLVSYDMPILPEYEKVD
jgi:hypothetical protein